MIEQLHPRPRSLAGVGRLLQTFLGMPLAMQQVEKLRLFMRARLEQRSNRWGKYQVTARCMIKKSSRTSPLRRIWWHDGAGERLQCISAAGRMLITASVSSDSPHFYGLAKILCIKSDSQANGRRGLALPCDKAGYPGQTSWPWRSLDRLVWRQLVRSLAPPGHLCSWGLGSAER